MGRCLMLVECDVPVFGKLKRAVGIVRAHVSPPSTMTQPCRGSAADPRHMMCR